MRFALNVVDMPRFLPSSFWHSLSNENIMLVPSSGNEEGSEATYVVLSSVKPAIGESKKNIEVDAQLRWDNSTILHST